MTAIVMDRLARAALVCGFLFIAASPSAAQSCYADYSAYADGGYESLDLYGWGSGYDQSWCNPPGYCYHTPRIWIEIWQDQQLIEDGYQDNYEISTEVQVIPATYRIDVYFDPWCSCVGGSAGATPAYASQSVQVPPPSQTPSSLNNYFDTYLSPTPSGNRYWRVRDYQVMDQNTPPNPINRIMTTAETFTTPQNTCSNFSFIEGGGPTQPNGTFRDNFYMSNNVAPCNTGGSCTIVRNQTWRVDGNQVGQFTVTYTCSGVTVQ